ncbi:hypothetical protein ACFL18_01455 [Patescibacteria group bacterium]
MNTRINVYFPPTTYQELGLLADKKGMSKPSFIKHIFELYKILISQKTFLLTDSAAQTVKQARKDFQQKKTTDYNSVDDLMADLE